MEPRREMDRDRGWRTGLAARFYVVDVVFCVGVVLLLMWVQRRDRPGTVVADRFQRPPVSANDDEPVGRQDHDPH
ncbi:MAG: hypothetical protein P8174_08680 [Gemmatimonadota bacterium]